MLITQKKNNSLNIRYNQIFLEDKLITIYQESTSMYYRIIIIGFFLINGCSTQLSVHSEIEKIANAQLAIVKAQQSNAQEWAPETLRAAQQKLQQAKQAVQSENDDKAARLAEIALIEAKLAEAKAETEMARQALFKMRDSRLALKKKEKKSVLSETVFRTDQPNKSPESKIP
jgi:biopolymer transport protein ExbB/TolQ